MSDTRLVTSLDSRFLKGERKGRFNERRVEQALQKMLESGEITYYSKTEDYGELDVRGIDFSVYPKSHLKIALQVKSSEKGKERHIEKYGESIPCIIVDDAMTDFQLLQEVRRILELPPVVTTESH